MLKNITAAGLAALVKKHGSVKSAARAAQVPETTFRRRLSGGEPAKAAAGVARGGRSLAEFRSEFDRDYIVPRKIRAALAALGTAWLYEVEFAKAARVSLADLGNYRDAFIAHVVLLKRDSRRVWAGTRKLAARLRGML